MKRRTTGSSPSQPPSPVERAEEAAKVLGVAEVGEPRRAVLRVPDARFHLHIPGTTGAGKSTLLANLVIGDVAAGRGAVVIDPKGDLITDLLDRLPASTAGRLVLIDPAETTAPAAVNVLQGRDPWRTTEDLVAIMRRIFTAYWGPRTDDLLRCSCLTLIRHRGATLADIPRLLNDPGFRTPFVRAVQPDPDLAGFWSWYQSLTPGTQATVTGPLLSKLRAILARPFIRSLLGTAASTFDIGHVLDGGVLLARLPKGELGEDTARLVGSILVAKVWQATLARSSTPQQRRRDCGLYLDECQNFLNLASPVAEMLAEARGYRLSITLAHQYFGQLGTELAHAISANALNKVVFRLEPDDARTMTRHLGPALTPQDLAGLGSHRVACRILHHAQPVPAFTLRTLPPAPFRSGRAALLRHAARRYGLTAEQRGTGLDRDHIASEKDDAAAFAPAFGPAFAPAFVFSNEHTYRRETPVHDPDNGPAGDRDFLED